SRHAGNKDTRLDFTILRLKDLMEIQSILLRLYQEFAVGRNAARDGIANVERRYIESLPSDSPGLKAATEIRLAK
ncbi:hypothetical protein ACSTLH_00495, partial [Vibrio parahaemolyticus]